MGYCKFAIGFVSMVLFISQAHGQQVVTSAGGINANSSIQVSWSLGEVVTGSFSNSSFQFSQGMQASVYSEVDIITNLPNEVSANIRLYPNPSSHSININIGSPGFTGMTYALTDHQGVVIQEGDIPEKEFQMDIRSLSQGFYLLRLQHRRGRMYTIKLLKK